MIVMEIYHQAIDSTHSELRLFAELCDSRDCDPPDARIKLIFIIVISILKYIEEL